MATQWVLLIVVLALSLLPFLTRIKVSWLYVTASIAALGVTMFGAIFWQKGRSDSPNIPVKVVERGYASSDTCRTCHQEYYSSWHDSYHRSMTQMASPETVVAPFDDVELHSRGRSYFLEREGDKYFITMADPEYEYHLQIQGYDLSKLTEPPVVRREVVMTTGSHHMQGYWINSGKGNNMFLLPWYYVFDEKKWIPREDCFISPPGSPRHFKMWNVACIHCHSVGGNPNLDDETGTLNSRVVEFGIACEACHGPGEAHVKKHQNMLSRYGQRRKEEDDPSIINPAKQPAKVAAQICAQCHSFHRTTIPNQQFNLNNANTYQPGEDLSETLRVIRFSDRDDPAFKQDVYGAYWGDGANRVGGDEYNAMIDSACFHGGQMSCISCHSSHNYHEPHDQLAKRFSGNQACLQCHKEVGEALEEHTHHAAGSAGSQCYNCHMPHTSYALFKALRSHRIDKPDLQKSVDSGRPNACNLCHLDKTLAWTNKYMMEWFDKPSVKLTENQQNVAASVLDLAQGNAIQRAIIIWHMGWEPAQEASGSDWQINHLEPIIQDPYAALRGIAGRAIRKHAGFKDFHFNFVGQDEELKRTRDKLLVRWRQRSDRRASASHLLLDEEGNLDAERYKALLKARNNEPVLIPQ